MLFEFTLVDLDAVEPWGPPGQATLHWFGLTDGCYWMNVGSSKLFEYSAAARQLGAPRYCSYQVARQYEDVVEALPYVMEVIPADLVSHLSGDCRRRTMERITAWSEACPERDDAAYWDTREHAVGWIGKREISTAHLSPSVDFVMWSDDAAVHVEWDNRAKVLQGVPAWSAAQGSCSVPRQQFFDEVRSFHDRLMQAMSVRVQAVAAGALLPGVTVDIAGLIREQEARALLSTMNFGSPPVPTDWSAVRRAIREINA